MNTMLPSHLPHVLGKGSKEATLAIIGECPTLEDMNGQTHFSSKAGQFLGTLLGSAGLSFYGSYLTHVIKTLPPRGQCGKVGELGTSIGVYIDYLKEELQSLPNLRVVIPVGEWALKALTGEDSITKWRGSYLRSSWFTDQGKDVWVIPTLAPENVQRFMYPQHVAMVSDLKRAQGALSGYKLKERVERIKPSLTDALYYLEECSNANAFSWDIETTRDPIQLTCIGFALSPTDSLCIPFKYGYKNYWTEGDELKIWEAIGRTLQSKALKITQNGIGFDDHIMKRYFGEQSSMPKFDTLLAHAYLYGDLKHGLDFLNSIYTDIPYYKDDTKDSETGLKFSTSSETLWHYNCKDVLATFEIYERLREELDGVGVLENFQGYLSPLFYALFDIEHVGAIISLEKREEMDATYTAQILKIWNSINDKVGYEINPDSDKQVKELVYGKMKLPPQKDKKTGNLTVGKKALDKLYNKTKNPVLKEIIAYRSLTTVRSTFLRAKLDPDGRMRTIYGMANTGRLKSKQTLTTVYDEAKGKNVKTGMNLQNVPGRGEVEGLSKNIRATFRAKEGWKVMEADLSQAEARAVAYLSGCTPMIRELEREGGDIFKLVASETLGKPFESITKKERQDTKASVHGSNYKMGPKTFAESTGVSMSEGRVKQGKYYIQFPEVPAWHEEIRRDLCATKRLTTPLGRTRFFFDRLPYTSSMGQDTWRASIAHIPQSTVGEFMNLGILKLYFNLMLPTPVEIWLQVHDSVVPHYPEEMEDRVIREVVKAYSKKIYIKGKWLTLPIEVCVGKDWGSVKEVNIEGYLEEVRT